MRLMPCLGVALLLMISGAAEARLPDPPSEDEVRDLVERVRIMAAGHTRVETRARIAQYISDSPGDQPRLTHHGGNLLIVRGYPWEGLWCLARSAQAQWVSPDTLSNIGFALAFVERHDYAERILLFTTDRWPEFHQAWTNLARVYLDAGRDDLAALALRRAEDAGPGSVPVEETRARWAMQTGDTGAAADALVNLSRLDPANPSIERLREIVPEEVLDAAVAERLASVPLPAHFIRLADPIDSYQDLVLDEEAHLYWRVTTEIYTRRATQMDHDATALSPEVWEQLPPDMQATLIGLGHGPGELISVPGPAVGRELYPLLSIMLTRNQERYLAALRTIYQEGEVGRILLAEQQRLEGYHRETMAALDAGATLDVVMDPYLHRCITSLEAAHPQWLAAMASARSRANELTRRHWFEAAVLISMLPPELHQDEIEYLQKQVALSNQRHAGAVVSWVNLGRMQVLMDREAAVIAADALHTAAAEREREAQMAREGTEEEWEDLELWSVEWEVVDLSGLLNPWAGVNAGVFSVKFYEDQVNVSGGEGLMGDAWFSWETMEFEMGIGYGVASPLLSPVASGGGTYRVLGVLRISGSDGAQIGIREHGQLTAGTAIAGVDMDVINEYTWLYGSGAR